MPQVYTCVAVMAGPTSMPISGNAFDAAQSTADGRPSSHPQCLRFFQQLLTEGPPEHAAAAGARVVWVGRPRLDVGTGGTADLAHA